MESRGHGVAAGVVVLLSFLGGLVTWRADVAGGYAAGYDRQGIVEALRFHGDSEQAEIQARTEERTYVAYLAAVQRRDAARAAVADPVASIEVTAETRIAERFGRAFPEELVRDGRFDVDGRTKELLTEREVREDSAALFARAEERQGRAGEVVPRSPPTVTTRVGPCPANPLSRGMTSPRRDVGDGGPLGREGEAGERRPLRDERLHGLPRRGPREVPALRGVAAEAAYLREVDLVLHALRDGREPERGRHADDGRDDRRVLG